MCAQGRASWRGGLRGLWGQASRWKEKEYFENRIRQTATPMPTTYEYVAG